MNGTKKDILVKPGAGNGNQLDPSGSTNMEPLKKPSDVPNPAYDLGRVLKVIAENQMTQTEIMDTIVQHMIDLERRVQALEGRAPREPLKGYL